MRRTIASLDKRIAFLEDQLRDARDNVRIQASVAAHDRETVRDLTDKIAAKDRAPRVTINVTGGVATFNGTAHSGQ